MKKFFTIMLLTGITLLYANNLEQMAYMQNIADRANAKIDKSKDLPRNTTTISKVTVKENYTLDIAYKTNFSNMELKKDFHVMNMIMMKRKFCRDDYYERMKDGFVMNFSYFMQNNELLTSFELKEENCRNESLVLNSVKSDRI
jgi:hypothetical protein